MLSHQHHTIEEADEDRMSAQEETTVDDDEPKRKRPAFKSVLQFWTIGIKFLEMFLCIFCIAMIIYPIKKSSVGTKYTYQLLLIFSTYGGYMIALAIILLGRLFGDRLGFKTNALFSIVGAFLHLATGCLILIDRIEFSRKYIFYPHMYMLDLMTTSGVFALVNMFIFAADAFFILKLQTDL